MTTKENTAVLSVALYVWETETGAKQLLAKLWEEYDVLSVGRPTDREIHVHLIAQGEEAGVTIFIRP